MVTSLSVDEFDARSLYEDEYCARGEMENRIKEQQLYLFADRTSAATMRANQLRLWFSSVAYTLLQVIRQFGLKGTPLARARCDTIRLKLLKIGASGAGDRATCLAFDGRKLPVPNAVRHRLRQPATPASPDGPRLTTHQTAQPSSAVVWRGGYAQYPQKTASWTPLRKLPAANRR